jgi:hypothetical protein
MSSEIEILIQLKKQLVTFLDELIETFPEEADFVIFRIFVNDQIPIVDIMEYIIEKICPLEKIVENREDSFFLENNILFEKFDDKKKGKVNHFRKMWQSKVLDKEDREVVWRWMNSFIVLGKKYNDCKKKK